MIGLLAGLGAVALLQGAGQVPLDDRWELSGDNTRIETYKGRRALRIRTGAAVRRDLRLQDGTIEFDVEVTPERSFVYLLFRVTGDGEYEELYFRPHKSSLPDAIQYSPVWNGESNWQLYHGRGATGRVPFPHGRWMHVRLVLQGRRAALFAGGGNDPNLVMALGREPAAGYLAFRSFVPPGGPAGGPVAAFANLVARPGYVPYSFPPEATRPAPSGLVRKWQLSPPFAAAAEPVTVVPEALLAGKASWPSFSVEANGVLVIGRHLARPADQAAAVARLILRAPSPRLQRVRLGYSDYLTVLHDGRPVFAGDAHYSHDEPRQEGLIGPSQATIWLPLREGDTEVLLAVADGFGGWGLTAIVEPADGAELVEPNR